MDIKMSTEYFFNELTIQTSSANTELLRQLPPVLRAREFNLYLNAGKRLTDLWLMGGRVILGHKPSRYVLELKNSAERGLFAPLPHPAEKRFLKALSQLFPSSENGNQYRFRFYESKLSLKIALDASGLKACLWRPFLNQSDQTQKLLIPILPCFIHVLVLDKSLEEHFPQGDMLSPVQLAPATRAIYNLLAAGENGGRPQYQSVNKALSKANKWKRQGIYLTRNSGIKENWEDLWKHFLEKGFLLPPSAFEPLILPGILSKGEEAKLAGLLEL